MTQNSIPAAEVTPAMVKTMIDRAKRGRYPQGVLGVRARPGATSESSFTYRDQTVRIVPAVSSLAVREAVRAADPEGWLIVVTDRSEEDLGDGLLAKFIWQRLRSPDPWQALQQRFAAQNIDARLLRSDNAREIATGLLELAPPDGWPPAPGGVLTREHAFRSLARAELGLPSGSLDLIAVLNWTTNLELPGMIARLRSRGGDTLVSAVLRWIADASGEATPLVAAVLGRGRPTDLVPLGVALECLQSVPSDSRHEAAVAEARLAHHWGDAPLSALEATGRLSAVTVSGLLGGTETYRDAQKLLERADELMAEAKAEPLAGSSRLLVSGLNARLRKLGEVMRTVPHHDSAALKDAWRAVTEHALSGHMLREYDSRVEPAAAGMRLVRWLDAVARGGEAEVGASLVRLARRHLLTDAWVDSAVNAASVGVDELLLASGLEHVLQQVREVRDEHDVQFARALAANGTDRLPDGLIGLEDLLPKVIAPLAKRQPTLLLVLDGMNAGVATEIMAREASSTDLGMVEHLLPGSSERTAALAVLPSVTEFSRTSLFSGELTSGGQADERRNFESRARALGLGDVRLVHKAGLDASRQGYSLADDVREAIEDTERYRLVGCVLNTIDDALDRTDPAGTDWTIEEVKHLSPLLRAARDAGRVVVITSDHGHVVERRTSTQRGTGLGARYRQAEPAVEGDEVLVEGTRVLAPGNQAVLAVNERLRYGMLKAGYHGGASPAEVVVPVLILASAGLDEELREAPPSEPEWWDLAVAATAAKVTGGVREEAQPTLFREMDSGAGAVQTGETLLASGTYETQRKLAGRVNVSDAAIAKLVNGLAAAPDAQLPASRVAALLGVTMPRVQMAMTQVIKVLNVEGYPVVSSDPATQTVKLDLALLAEQFGVSVG